MAYGDPTLYKGYLGGHNWITHTDCGSLEYMIEKFDIKTMLDLGCGPGGQVKTALDLGLVAEGIDGDPRVIAEAEGIVINECDYTKDTFEREVDFIWSVEFLEHVEEKYQENYMKTFAKAEHVFVTFAPIGKRGNHHVNLRDSNYWINIFEKYGLLHDAKITDSIRKASTMKREFVRENGLYFRNKRFKK
jgi:cyclopropane fatty-acyl-phospholipid synthase-like methyltransferase